MLGVVPDFVFGIDFLAADLANPVWDLERLDYFEIYFLGQGDLRCHRSRRRWNSIKSVAQFPH